MENGMKSARSRVSLMLVIVAVVYAIWPLDLMPYMPLDDFLLGALALVGACVSNMHIGERQ